MPPKKSPKAAASTNKQGLFMKCVWIFLLPALMAFTAYVGYAAMTRPPVTPSLDLNQYWGPYPIDVKPNLEIMKFQIEFSDVMINDLRERLLNYRKPPQPLENVGFTYGFNSHFLHQVAEYWRNKYDFKAREKFLNQYPHFKVNIQGLNIHYMHVKPTLTEGYEVVPLLLLHGWPGSFREFYEMIPKLTQPRDGKKFVFEVIVPSLPGFGYSEAAARPGLGPAQMAVLMRNLMKRLGYHRYCIQGGDLGHLVGSIMATVYQDDVIGFHTNFPTLVFNPWASLWMFIGSLWPNQFEIPELQDRMFPLKNQVAKNLEESGYMHIQATKPDTIGTALSDSPVGLAAYILEKFSTWTNPENRKAADGNLLEKFSLSHLLDNVMIYWTSNTIATSMRVYSETFSSNSSSIVFDQIPTSVPTWGIKFRHELMYQPDHILRMKYKNYLQSTIVDDGGHFASMENPDLLAKDVYEAVETFRKFNQHDVSKTKSVYDFTVKDINGKEISLQAYKGYVLIIVNVASQCMLTDTNYRELNELHEKFYDRGLRILAFPCNQFNSQEPGSSQDILKFTKAKEIQFKLFEKVDVNGPNASLLWKYLKTIQHGMLSDEIKWNFSKFIIDKNGIPVERLGPNVNPLDLEPYLSKYL